MSDKKTFTNKFKGKAIDLLKNSKKKSIEIVNDLGINWYNPLHWKKEFEKEEKPGLFFSGIWDLFELVYTHCSWD